MEPQLLGWKLFWLKIALRLESSFSLKNFEQKKVVTLIWRVVNDV